MTVLDLLRWPLAVVLSVAFLVAGALLGVRWIVPGVSRKKYLEVVEVVNGLVREVKRVSDEQVSAQNQINMSRRPK